MLKYFDCYLNLISLNILMSYTVLSLLSAQGTYVSHSRWALIEMLKTVQKIATLYCKIT